MEENKRNVKEGEEPPKSDLFQPWVGTSGISQTGRTPSSVGTTDGVVFVSREECRRQRGLSGTAPLLNPSLFLLSLGSVVLWH